MGVVQPAAAVMTVDGEQRAVLLIGSQSRPRSLSGSAARGEGGGGEGGGGDDHFPAFSLWELFGKSMHSGEFVSVNDPRLRSTGLSVYQLLQLRGVFRLCRRQWDLAVQVAHALRPITLRKGESAPLVALNLPMQYEDAHFAACDNCEQRFGFFTRRHHCRLCGSVFCSDCCFKKLDLRSIITYVRRADSVYVDSEGLSRVRTCESCAAVMHSILRTHAARLALARQGLEAR
jgi:hypothetical protein